MLAINIRMEGINYMKANGTELKQSELLAFLLEVAPIRPVFIWGAPGIGKSSLVQQFANDLGLECVSLLGSQLAPEDLIGIPKIEGNVSRFYPPSLIHREKEFCLFIDELNIASSEVQKSFYSLILEQRVGEYKLPKGSIIIGAGNRSSDNSLVKQMPSALINRIIHVHLKPDHRDWLSWASNHGIHENIIEYIKQRPNQLYTETPPTSEEPYSTPRSWEYLSDGLKLLQNTKSEKLLDALLFGTITKNHAIHFKAYMKQIKNKFAIWDIIKGNKEWPNKPEDRDLLFFMVHSLRALLIKELPENSDKLNSETKELVIKSKDAIKKLNHIDNELAQIILTEDENNDRLPPWFLIDITKELPRLLNNSK